MLENDIETYKKVLEQVWKDGIVSVNECAMLDVLREKLNITSEKHLELEIQARNKFTPQAKIVKEKVAQEKYKLDEPLQKKEQEIPSKTQSFEMPMKRDEQVQTTQYTKPQQIIQESEKQYPCSICKQPLSYIAQYKRWYCYNCKKYA